MFDNEGGPLGARTRLSLFCAMQTAAAPEALRPKLSQLITEPTPPNALVGGMETLYAAVRDLDLADRADYLQMLGELAVAVAGINLWGKGERAYAMAAWAYSELGNAQPGMPAPEPVEVDPAHSFAPSAPVETPEA